MSLSIAHFSSRKDPRWQWFCDSLCNEFNGPVDAQIIFIDFWLQYDGDARRQELADIVKGRFQYEHYSPMPNAWQGVHKKTRDQWWNASGVRNTAICYARNSHLACVDDLSVLQSQWLVQVRHSETHGYLVQGMYEKHNDMVVENGKIISSTPSSRDSRFVYSDRGGIVEHPAHNCFGCSFALPIEAILQVGGYDEIANGTSMEDVLFGVKIGRLGLKSYLNQNMQTIECDACHGEGPNVKREARPVEGFSYEGHNDSGWWLVANCMRNNGYVTSIGNDYDLRELRDHILNGGEFPLPKTEIDWATKKPLSELHELYP